MNYKDAIEFIGSTYRLGSRPGLDNITRLLELMKKPQISYKAIHAAGTNGKGSTCAFVASMLEEAGYLTGLYTSPHLERFTERIRVSRREIGRRDVGEITGQVKRCIEIMLQEGYPHPTEFEIITAIGFEYFKRRRVDYAVLEVGMGGRLDATNVVKPEISIITPISMDHMDALGRDPVSIAREKAGIIKKGVPVICGSQQPEVMKTIKDICQDKGAPLLYAGDCRIENLKPLGMGQAFDLVCQGTGFENIQTGLIGRHQAENAALALAAGLKLGIPEQKIREGIRKTRWPGRMEVIRQHPLVLIDGAHNVEGAKALREGLKQFYPGRKVLLVFGMLRDKEVERVAGIMAPYASRVVTVPPASPRAMGPEELRDIVAEYNSNVLCAGSVKQAVDEFVSAAADEMVVFTGSLYMIGEVRRLLPPEIL